MAKTITFLCIRTLEQVRSSYLLVASPYADLWPKRLINGVVAANTRW